MRISKLYHAVICITLTSSLLLPIPMFSTKALAAAPAPTLHDENPHGAFGDWYTGAIPPNASLDKPVILFVQGLHATYKKFYRDGGLYEAAYNSGYRTAFVQLRDADGDGGNMYTNGEKLAEVIKKVADYYNVKQIAIVAHSKGGVDTQAALIHYGAAPYVHTVHQLATPNKGSELADLAYSSWFSWLAEILGKKDDAVYSLQTSYMANFRKQTDNHRDINKTRTYMAAGTGDDGIFTKYWFAHAVLPGEDDGAVTVDSAFGLPYGIKTFKKNISHTAITDAKHVWSEVESNIRKSSKELQPNFAPELDREYQLDEEENTPASIVSNTIVRGGKIKGKTQDTFLLESGVSQMMVDVMTANEKTKVKLISPSGKEYTPKRLGDSDFDSETDVDGDETQELFASAIHHGFKIDDPEKGKWKLVASGKNDAYFMFAQVESDQPMEVVSEKKIYEPGERGEIRVELPEATIKKQAIANVSMVETKNRQLLAAEDYLKIKEKDDEIQGTFKAPREPGVYNICLEITGVNEFGEEFSRSVWYNFAVIDEDAEEEL
ncbi:alpha/beta hydrolase [Brevibacillus halotolerans]|uniref:esterase/lipase family protein n=1 Tax=Brevibacillus TaxID=55080 RepID=UPI00215BCBD1|nr:MULTISPECIES: alpha/beta hydrolase [Brevibacillus]MCR8963318.1 alpha/beta hydrolase [Brevibacillus laterosporus]MCZ0835474.1 alpha/beta hydrolase [Brevibacillus halotolerans]